MNLRGRAWLGLASVLERLRLDRAAWWAVMRAAKAWQYDPIPRDKE